MEISLNKPVKGKHEQFCCYRSSDYLINLAVQLENKLFLLSCYKIPVDKLNSSAYYDKATCFEGYF